MYCIENLFIKINNSTFRSVSEYCARRKNIQLYLIGDFSVLEKAESALSKIIVSNIIKDHVIVYKHTDPVAKQIEV